MPTKRDVWEVPIKIRITEFEAQGAAVISSRCLQQGTTITQLCDELVALSEELESQEAGKQWASKLCLVMGAAMIGDLALSAIFRSSADAELCGQLLTIRDLLDAIGERL